MRASNTAVRFRFFLVPLFFMLACVGVYAQANSEITGIVTDQTGAVVAGATITLTDPATGSIHTTTSGATGLYDISGLNPADYDLKAAASGFETFIQTGIVINTSAIARVDVKLTVGAEATTVTVEANALAVQSDSNVVSTLISEQQITELATNGRNVVALAALGLGVSGNLPDSNTPSSVGSSFAISFNGLNQAHNIWLIDGGEAYDRGSGGKSSMMPSQDALAEFQVMASNYPADYGISSGGTISMSIKSGSQKFHGELWEFVRNDALQAHNYFDKPGAQKPELRLNIFGGNVGGPLFIPRVYNTEKKKTFFFFNEEWRKIVQGSAPAGIHAVPSADFITSAQDFTYTLPAYAPGSQTSVFVPVVDPSSTLGKAIAGHPDLVMGQPFPNNKIYADLLDPSALAVNNVGAIPKANTSGDLVSVSSKQPLNVREDLLRIDHNINDKWQLFGHYIHDSVSQTYATSMWSGDSYPTVGSNFSNPSNSAVIKLTGTITANTLVEAAVNYDGNKIDIQPSGSAYKKPSGWGAGSFFPASYDGLNRLPSVNLTSWGTQFDPWSQPWKNAAQDLAEVVGLSVTQGKHAMKFGGGYNRYTKNQQIFGNTNGFYTFTDGWDKDKLTPTGVLTGDSYLDFLLGTSTNYSQLENQDIRHYVNQTVSAYALDNWHVNNRLTLQLGIRYDALPHAWERNNRISSFDPSQYQAALAPQIDPKTAAFIPSSPGLQQVEGNYYYLNGVTIAGQNKTPRGLTNNDYNTWQPRIGFSYDLLGDGKTVLRGGFGNFYERMQGNDVYNVSAASPFSNTPSLGNVTLSDPFANWQSGSHLSNASLPVVPQGRTSIGSNYKAPGVSQYSLGVQREILPSLILATQYVGNLAWHQNVQWPLNPYPLTTPLVAPAGCQIEANAGQTDFVQSTCAISRQVASNGKLSSANSALARTYPGFTSITEESNWATGTYNSFQMGLRQQSKKGLSFEVDYTWSHQIDDQIGSADLTTISNPWNLKYDKGSGNLDRRNILNINYMYKLPIFAHSSGIAHSILGGWEISGTVIAESGLPWAGSNTPGYGGPDTVGLGGNYTIHSNFTGKSVKYPKARGANGVYQWVSNEGFSNPVASWNGGPNLGFGNAGRDIIVGPGRTNFGTNIYKAFHITESTHFEFRAESFNTFNHTQFNGFHNSLTGSDFGQVSGVQDPRTFELGGKFVF
jgi:hypothetical protein